jgi:uncharacterized protein (TIGR04255 family)
MKFSILSKAPIREAIINIIVKLPSDITINDIEKIYDSVKDKYPTKKDFIESKANIGSQFIKTSNNKIGFSLFSSDNLQVMQPRLNSFIFNRLSPYENWEIFSSEAKRLWQIYREATCPEITKLALRYINILEIPAKCNMIDYLTSPPTIPPQLSQNQYISNFLHRVFITDTTNNCSASITQLLEKTINDISTILLDIEVFTNISSTFSDNELWEMMEFLCKYKDNIFYASITEKLLEKYK